MKNPPAPQSSDPQPRLLRTAGRWSSWAGAGLTILGRLLALTGHFKLTTPTQLRAAPPEEPAWKPAQKADEPKPAPVTTPATEDPFRAVRGPISPFPLAGEGRGGGYGLS